MNESDFENELRRVRPAPPSENLLDRIATDFTSSPASLTPASGTLTRPETPAAWRWLGRFAWTCGGAAAALAATLPTNNSASSRPVPEAPMKAEVTAPDFEIVDASRELITAKDEGLLFIRETEPQRQMRLSYIERMTWTNPETGAVIECETPREGVVLMPVAFQ